MAEGWKCPHCGKAHAPDVKTCPEPGGLGLGQLPFGPATSQADADKWRRFAMANNQTVAS